LRQHERGRIRSASGAPGHRLNSPYEPTSPNAVETEAEQHRFAREADSTARARASVAAGYYATSAEVNAWIDRLDSEFPLPASSAPSAASLIRPASPGDTRPEDALATGASLWPPGDPDLVPEYTSWRAPNGAGVEMNDWLEADP
jgi:hypothetical protein